MTEHTDPDGFLIATLLIKIADLETQLDDCTTEADHLRAELEQRLVDAGTPCTEGQQ